VRRIAIIQKTIDNFIGKVIPISDDSNVPVQTNAGNVAGIPDEGKEIHGSIFIQKIGFQHDNNSCVRAGPPRP
jgi:hypothetical protein